VIQSGIWVSGLPFAESIHLIRRGAVSVIHGFEPCIWELAEHFAPPSTLIIVPIFFPSTLISKTLGTPILSCPNEPRYFFLLTGILPVGQSEPDFTFIFLVPVVNCHAYHKTFCCSNLKAC
jgi:hypothetical protein